MPTSYRRVHGSSLIATSDSVPNPDLGKAAGSAWVPTTHGGPRTNSQLLAGARTALLVAGTRGVNEQTEDFHLALYLSN